MAVVKCDMAKCKYNSIVDECILHEIWIREEEVNYGCAVAEYAICENYEEEV